ncbi:MAG TPA: M48 family metallopeptidase, partial [Vicinamibacterales bacterium]|nr:M48 family metallopeptidase [Vicinamibacterales bacterium]
MKKLPTLVAMLTAVPLVAWAVGTSLTLREERRWQAALAERYSQVPADLRAAFTLEVACRDPDVRQALSGACGTQSVLASLRVGGIATGAIGLGWLGLVALGGHLARGRRAVLLAVFRPGLYLTAILLVVLISAHGILAVASLYLGEATLTGRVHGQVILAIAAGALFGVVAVARSAFGIVHPATISVIGTTIAEAAHPRLWQVVRQTAATVGTAPPDVVVAGLEPSFFVTEAIVKSPEGLHAGRTLFVSLALARILTIEEFRAVLGHELAHYKGQDTEFSRKFYPIYRGTWDALAGLERSGEGPGQIALLPARAVLSFFLEAFATAEREIGRERELAADREGAVVAGTRAIAAALVKVHAFADCWTAIRGEMARVLGDGRAYTNVSSLFASVAAAAARPEALAGLADRRSAHPTDSHPP